MTGLHFRLKSAPGERLDLSCLHIAALAALPVGDIERMVIGTSKHVLKVGDVFAVSGTPGERLTIAGGSDRFDFVGLNNKTGHIVVEGDVGSHAGSGMSGGRLEIHGNAGASLAAGLKGGLILVDGTAGDYVGAPPTGARFGMLGGVVLVKGGIGERAGDRMRRGTILSPKRIGAMCGARMMGGTIWSATGLGDGAGTLMRRGTLIAPAVDRLPSTFVDCGRHQLTILTIISRYLADVLGPAAPKLPTGPVRRLAGDMAALGKGEILIPA